MAILEIWIRVRSPRITAGKISAGSSDSSSESPELSSGRTPLRAAVWQMSGTSVESPRIHRAIDMANQNGDINAFNGGNSKSSKGVRQVPHEARATRRVGDRL